MIYVAGNASAVRESTISQEAQIAQLVEQRTENPRVAGSIPALGTLIGCNKKFVKRTFRCFIFIHYAGVVQW